MIKFIILGIPRSGTTVVSGSIITHPELLFYGELFNSMMEVRASEAARITLGAGWKFETAMGWGLQACSDQQGTYQYLDNFFARKVPFTAVGFKLLYDQAIEGPNRDVWDYIAQHPEIKIIRTHREELLEIVCSYVRARMTRRWHMSGTVERGSKFVVPPHEFQALMERFSSIPEAARTLDETHEILDLEYSDISASFQDCLSRIYAYLDVDVNVVATPKLSKIARMKPDEELANYQELKQYFKGTKYSEHFPY